MNIRQNLCLGVLIAFALLNGVKWGMHFSENPYRPIDFRTYYLGGKAFFNGSNPYEDSVQLRLWQDMPDTDSKQWQNTGFPHAVPVYAPQFVWYFSVYQFLYFELAKWLQLVLNICSLLLIVWCVKQLRTSLKYSLIIAAVLSFRGTWYALDTGQPMLQVLALAIFSIYLVNRPNLQGLSAFLLALVSFKFTLMIPVVIYLLCKKKFKVFSMYFFMVLILNTLALIFANDPMALLQSWQANIQRLWYFTHWHQLIHGLNIISTSASVSARYFIDIPFHIIQAANAVLLLAGFGFSFYTGFKNSARAAMLIACMTGLCFGHHMVYDLLALICFLLIVKDGKLVHNVFFYLPALLMMAPLGSIAQWLKIPWLDFTLPMCLLLYWCFMVYYYFPRGNGTSKGT